MKKKLISLAVATAMAAPAAAMAEAIIYGKLHVSLDYANVENAAMRPIYTNPAAGISPAIVAPTAASLRDGVNNQGIDFNGWGVNRAGDFMPGAGRANRVGIKGSEDLGNGLKAIYQVELGVSLADTNDNVTSGGDAITMRNSFVGLAGSFGTVLIGRHDTPLKISTGKLDMFSDTMADYNGTIGFDDIRADNAVAYISPSFSGFQFMGALVAPGGATGIGDENVNSDQLNGAWSLAGIYSNGPFYGSIAYESLSNEMFMDSAASVAGSDGTNCVNAAGAVIFADDNQLGSPGCAYVGDSYDKWRLGAGILDWNGFTLTAIWEKQENLPQGQVYRFTAPGPAGLTNVPVWDGMKKQTLWQVQAGYAFGNNMIKAMYGQAQRDYDFSAANYAPGTFGQRDLDAFNDADGTRSAWAIAFDHNFSKRTKAYVLYTSVDDGREDYGTVANYLDNYYSGGNFQDGIAATSWSGFSLGMIHKF